MKKDFIHKVYKIYPA